MHLADTFIQSNSINNLVTRYNKFSFVLVNYIS